MGWPEGTGRGGVKESSKNCASRWKDRNIGLDFFQEFDSVCRHLPINMPFTGISSCFILPTTFPVFPGITSQINSYSES